MYGNSHEAQTAGHAKSNSRNGPRGDSFHQIGEPNGSNFNGDTGRDYNIQN